MYLAGEKSLQMVVQREEHTEVMEQSENLPLSKLLWILNEPALLKAQQVHPIAMYPGHQTTPSYIAFYVRLP